MKTIAIIQARMGSSRLPGKVLEEIEGHSMLFHVVERVKAAETIDVVVVATTVSAGDDLIEKACLDMGVSCYRGDECDVLDRYYQAALQHDAQAVVRITADCPLLDPDIVDAVMRKLRADEADYAANIITRTFPDGLDCEAFTFLGLTTVWKEAKLASDREHVTPYFRNSGKFKLTNVESKSARASADERWTVDEPSDLEFVRAIYKSGLDRTGCFSWLKVLKLLNEDPDIRKLQGNTIQNEGYYKSLYQQAVPGAATKRCIEKSIRMHARASKVIPGCSQTFSKASNQYVEGVSPIFLDHGKGCRVWDVDGNEYIDYIQGLLPNILGYAHDEVNEAFSSQAAKGHSFSLAHPVELELAERLIEVIPCAEMVRFGKNGSDVTAGAVRVARAFTGRDRIACCGYHGWQDWFIGSTTRNQGVPQAVRDLTHPFAYNDLNALEALLSSHRGEFAAVIMEPVNFIPPDSGYLEGVKAIAKKHGALLIFDEICSGFHFGLGGAQRRFGVTPDLACFGKAMGNGYPISCLVGRADVMQICSEIFFSFTFAGEVASMAAALKVLDVLEQTDAIARIEENGVRLKDGFNALSKEAGLQDRLVCEGYPNWSILRFMDSNGQASLLVRSLWQQECVKRGLLQLVTHNLTTANDHSTTDRTLEVYAEVFKTLSDWLSHKDPSQFLEGKMIEVVFSVRK